MQNLLQIEAALQSVAEGRVTVLPETDSTNNNAKTLALSGAPNGSVVLALSQTSGRGRLGRAFSSQEGGLYFSFIVKGSKAQNPAHLTVCAAIAAAHAIESLCSLSVGIKWVNDLHINGKKCAGILVEGVYDGEHPLPVAAVVGIGINVSNPLPPEFTSIATSLAKEGAEVSLTDLAKALTTALTSALQDPQCPIEEYRRRSVLLKKTVLVHTPIESYPALVLGITDEGALRVKRGEKEVILQAGEVTLHNPQYS